MEVVIPELLELGDDYFRLGFLERTSLGFGDNDSTLCGLILSFSKIFTRIVVD